MLNKAYYYKRYNLRLQTAERQLRSSGEDSISIGTTDWLITSLIPPNSSNLVPIQDFSKDLKSKASVSTCRTQQI
jgi:hypothetical protein